MRSNTVHRHEPPITNDPILVLHKDEEKGYVMVSKPGSVVSASASYDTSFYLYAISTRMPWGHGTRR